MKAKAKTEANVALLQAHNSYQLLLREGYRFQLAKKNNNDILPGHLWPEWRRWKQRIKEADAKIERFYK